MKQLEGRVYNVFINPHSWYKQQGRGRGTDDKIRMELELVKAHGDLPLWCCPIDIELDFNMSIPRTAGFKNRGTMFHTIWPSAHELANAFINQLRDIVITNPDIICRIHVRKIYAKTPRINCLITESRYE